MTPDLELLTWINQQWSSPLLDHFFWWISRFNQFALPLLLLLLWDAWRRSGRDGLLWWLAVVLLVALGDAAGAQLKALFAEHRPCYTNFDLVRTHSGKRCGAAMTGMPSNHALNFFAVATFVMLSTRWRYWQLVLVITAVLVGLSRIYLAKHLPSQVVFGAWLGVLFGILAACLYSFPTCLEKLLMPGSKRRFSRLE